MFHRDLVRPDIVARNFRIVLNLNGPLLVAVEHLEQALHTWGQSPDERPLTPGGKTAEIGADVILKATKVDGVYDRDPNTDANAKFYERITFTEALTKRLQIMDSTAFSLCMDNKIPIVVFDMNKPSNIRDAVLGRKVGTLVCDEPQPK